MTRSRGKPKSSSCQNCDAQPERLAILGMGEDHVFGRKLIFESCCRSCAVNFHFWL